MKLPIKPGTIFISIASYRDEVCNDTLKSIYKMAANPKNVYCGLVQQNDLDNDDDCLLKSDDSIVTENVRNVRLKHFEAKGPCWARYLASTLWSGEEYFLQIDSHSRFVKNWDIKCIDMVKKISENGNKKVVISHYPPGYEQYKDENVLPHRLCQSFFNNNGMLSFLGAESMDTNGECHENAYVAGGFLLSRYTLLEDVPYDPNLDFLFVGEEIGHSIRIWTSGYDIYSPSENIVFHEYTREGKPKIWDDNIYSNKDALEKVKQMIGLDSIHTLPKNIKYNIKKYGLGKERTLEEYYEFAGIDLKKKRVYKNFCRPNNIGSEDDIKQSNEKDHEGSKEKKIENFWDFFNIYFYYFISFFVFVLLICLVFFYTKGFQNILKKKFKKGKRQNWFL